MPSLLFAYFKISLTVTLHRKKFFHSNLRVRLRIFAFHKTRALRFSRPTARRESGKTFASRSRTADSKLPAAAARSTSNIPRPAGRANKKFEIAAKPAIIF